MQKNKRPKLIEHVTGGVEGRGQAEAHCREKTRPPHPRRCRKSPPTPGRSKNFRVCRRSGREGGGKKRGFTGEWIPSCGKDGGDAEGPSPLPSSSTPGRAAAESHEASLVMDFFHGSGDDVSIHRVMDGVGDGVEGFGCRRRR
jgi:hypothetical protein